MTAAISLSPNPAVASASVRIVGTGFSRFHSVSVTLDGAVLLRAKTNRSGGFTATFTAPAAGSHDVIATTGSVWAHVTLLVTAPAALPVIPAGATVLLLDQFDKVGLDTTKWNSPSLFHCCGTTVTNGGLVAGYAGPIKVAGDGQMVMEAVRDSSGHWQVPIIDTKGKVELTPPVHVEVQAKLPVGRGLWPAALWLYGAGGSPEIDVNETLANPVGTAPFPTMDVRFDLVHVHYAGGQWGGHAELPSGAALSDDFHIFGCDWHADRVVLLLDGVVIGTFNPTDKTQIPTGPLHLLVNLGVSNGKDWGGNLSADASTPSPASQVVKYVAAWRIAL